jgi:hypothetical protein
MIICGDLSAGLACGQPSINFYAFDVLTRTAFPSHATNSTLRNATLICLERARARRSSPMERKLTMGGVKSDVVMISLMDLADVKKTVSLGLPPEALNISAPSQAAVRSKRRRPWFFGQTA